MLRPTARILADGQRAARVRSLGLRVRNLTTHCANLCDGAAGGCAFSDAYIRALAEANARGVEP